MADETPLELYSSATLADVAAVTQGDTSYIVAVDHTYEPVRTAASHPVEKTIWHFWMRESAGRGATFHKLADGLIPLPAPQAVAVSMAVDSLAAVIEANNETPAWLMIWNLTAGGIANVADVTPHAIPLHLDVAHLSRIHIPHGSDWSSPFLPCPLWLFHANLFAIPETGRLVAALNTADAHAIVFQFAPGEAAAKAIAFVPEALEPAYATADGRSLLFYRKPTPQWSVFFHDVRISGKFGPIALPLEVAELNSAGGIDQPKRLDVGDVFVYAIRLRPDGRITLAAVGGSKQKPELKQYMSDKTGRQFQLRSTVPLRHVPFRVSMTFDKQGTLMALGFLGEGGGFGVETLYVKDE
jgi:hypothetical protein